MTLDEYMKAEGAPTPAEFAVLISRSVSLVSLLRDNKRTPSLKTVQAIFDATKGAVGLSDWPVDNTEAAA